jgi:hypothetical protein
MESTGFPRRLDLFKEVAAGLAKKRAEDEGEQGEGYYTPWKKL